jgi:hypothetical protein
MNDLIFFDIGFYFLACGGVLAENCHYKFLSDIYTTKTTIQQLGNLYKYPNHIHRGVRNTRIYKVLKIYSTPKDNFYSTQC